MSLSTSSLYVVCFKMQTGRELPLHSASLEDGADLLLRSGRGGETTMGLLHHPVG